MKDDSIKQKYIAVNEALKAIYDMALYTDKNMGSEDYMIENLPPYYQEEVVNGITVLKTVYDSPLKEPQLFIKLNGLKARYVYGEWYNVKHKECQLYISADSDYKGNDRASVSEVLNLLNEFITSNHYYVKAKTSDNKIYDDNDKVLNEKTVIDLIDNKYVANVTLSNITITSEDIDELSSMFNHLKSLTTNKCTMDRNVSMNRLPIMYYHDHSSNFDSFKAFDYVTFDVGLYQSMFLHNFDGVLHLDSKMLTMDQVDINYELFFLKTFATNLTSLTIKNETPLTERDLRFMTGFYNLESLDIYAEVKNYDFLYKLDKLQEVSDSLMITDKKELERIKELRSHVLEEWQKSNPDYFEKEFNLKHYLMFQRAIIENKYRDFYKQIRVPRVALVKWMDMVNRAEEDIKKHLEVISKMPSKKRSLLGQDDNVDLVIKKGEDYLTILGFDTSAKTSSSLSRYQSMVMGADGDPLLRELPLMDLSCRTPFLDHNGELLCEFNYRNERTITIPKHIKEYVHEQRKDESPNLTKYYAQYKNHDRKLKYLSQMLIDTFRGITFDEALKEKYNNIINKYVHEQRVLDLTNEYETYFMHNYFSLLIGTDMMDRITDYGTTEEVLSSLFDEYEIDEEDKVKVSKDFHKLCHYKDVKNGIVKRDLSITKIIESYFKDCNISVVDQLDLEHINDYMLSDIESLSSNLSDSDQALFKYYVLYLQEQYDARLESKISDINNIIFEHEETVGGVYSWPYFTDILEEEGIDGLLSRELISKEEYQKLCTLDMARDMLSDLESKRENVLDKRVTLLFNHLDTIKQFSLGDVLQIKQSIPLVGENVYDKDALYMDQIITFITGDYPEWIKRDIEKLSKDKAIEEDKNEVKRTYVSAEQIRIKKRNVTTKMYTPF